MLGKITGPARVQPLDPASKEEHKANLPMPIPAVPNQAASRRIDHAITFQDKRRRLQATPLKPKRSSTASTMQVLNGHDKWDIDKETPLSVEIFQIDADDSDDFGDFFTQPSLVVGIGDASYSPEQPPSAAVRV